MVNALLGLLFARGEGLPIAIGDNPEHSPEDVTIPHGRGWRLLMPVPWVGTGLPAQ